MNSRAFLQLAVTGHPTAGDIDSLLAARPTEDLYLDFKSGLALTAPLPKDRFTPAKLREYVAAFANSDGGALVLGVAEPPNPGAARPIDGIAAPQNAKPWQEWVDDGLAPLAPYLSSAHQRHLVAHPTGSVLVLAVRRSERLVPCLENGQLVYYLRFGHQTIKAPPYLIEDLFLHRRARPSFLVAASAHGAKSSNSTNVSMTINTVIRNVTMVWAEQPHVGVVGWTVKPESSDHRRSISHDITSKVQVTEPAIPLSGGLSYRLHLDQDYRHAGLQRYPTNGPKLPPMDLPPYETFYANFNVELPPEPADCVWTGALYVVARNSAPIWYRLEIRYKRAAADDVQVEPVRLPPPVDQEHTIVIGWARP